MEGEGKARGLLVVNHLLANSDGRDGSHVRFLKPGQTVVATSGLYSSRPAMLMSWGRRRYSALLLGVCFRAVSALSES